MFLEFTWTQSLLCIDCGRQVYCHPTAEATIRSMRTPLSATGGMNTEGVGAKGQRREVTSSYLSMIVWATELVFVSARVAARPFASLRFGPLALGRSGQILRPTTLPAGLDRF